jgi:dolichyl-diphosphooligosaccharide--protein glycosyltransferase
MSREESSSKLRRFAKILKSKIPPPTLENVGVAIILILNFALTLGIRLIPLFKYGVYLNEFDPYFQYYNAQYVVNHGWYGFIAWFYQGINYDFWRPMGRAIASNAYPGTGFIGAFVYLVLQGLGINLPLKYVVGFITPFSAAFAGVLMYYIGKEIQGKATGLLASFFYAITSADIPRTAYGFFDDDGTSQVFLALFMLAFIRSIKKKSWVYPIITGLTLSIIIMTWGSFIYFINLFALAVLILAFLGREIDNVSRTYFIGMTLSILTMYAIPRTNTFLLSGYTFLPYITYPILFVIRYFKQIPRIKVGVYSFIILLIGLLGAYVLSYFNIVKGIAAKYQIILDPLARTNDPWVDSVAEHVAASWSQFFINYGILIIFIPLGFYIITKRRSSMDIFIFLAGFTTLWAAASTSRLFMLSTIPNIIIGSLALEVLFTNYASILRQRRETFIERKRGRLFRGIPPSYSAFLILVLVIMSLIASLAIYPNAVTYASSPPSILASQTGSYTTDWVAALSWLKHNTPPGSVVAAWWDYGYWITIVGDRPTVCDNANFNETQIQLVGAALLATNETRALQIFKYFGASYVLVYEQFYQIPQLNLWINIGGDIEKSYWMARIAFNYSDQQVRQLYLNTTTINIYGTQLTVTIPNGPYGSKAILYRMIYADIPGQRSMANYPQEIQNLNFAPLKYFQLVYASPEGSVLIYKINYPQNFVEPPVSVIMSYIYHWPGMKY